MNTIRIINTKDGKTANQFETIIWCIKAVSGDATRQKLRHLYIDKDFIAGCDGHRLHIALNDWDLEPGLYEILAVKSHEILLAKSEDLFPKDYPSIWDVIPTQSNNGIPPFSCYMDRKHEFTNKSYFLYHVYVNTRHCYNLKYLEDIRMEGNMQFELGKDMPHMLVVASENHDRLAMVMPFDQ